MVKTTKAQRKALFRIFQREYPERDTPFKRNGGPLCPHCGNWAGVTHRVSSRPYRAFRSQVVGYPDGSGCVMLPWRGMWLGIEKDGYTHS
jgi:hypothetical protein